MENRFVMRINLWKNIKAKIASNCIYKSINKGD